MITENTEALRQASVAQIQVLAHIKNLADHAGSSRTPEERNATRSEIGVAEYLHNHSEIVRIFQSQTETEFVPYEN